MFGSSENPVVRNVCKSLKTNGVSHEEYTAQTMMRRYPKQLTLPANHVGVLENDGGILKAAKAVQTFQVDLSMSDLF